MEKNKKLTSEEEKEEYRLACKKRNPNFPCHNCGNPVTDNDRWVTFCDKCCDELDSKPNPCPKCGTHLIQDETNLYRIYCPNCASGAEFRLVKEVLN